MVLSIITINYNNSEGLYATILSVLDQTFKDFEYIVIDGGSTDKSVEIIKSNINQIDYWISEKDNGIYHAMNKGIKQAKGQYLLMLNSGDVLADKSIISQVFEINNLNEDILYGNVSWVHKGKFYANSDFPKQLSFKYFWERSIGHQATFIKKTAHDIVGLYDQKVKISADWKFFLLAYEKYKLSFRFLPLTISICDNHGLTWNPINFSAIRKEQEITISKYFHKQFHEYKQFRKTTNPMIITRLRIFKKRLKKLIPAVFK